MRNRKSRVTQPSKLEAMQVACGSHTGTRLQMHLLMQTCEPFPVPKSLDLEFQDQR